MDKLTLFFLERGSTFEDASDYAFLIIAGLVIVGMIVFMMYLAYIFIQQ